MDRLSPQHIKKTLLLYIQLDLVFFTFVSGLPSTFFKQGSGYLAWWGDFLALAWMKRIPCPKHGTHDHLGRRWWFSMNSGFGIFLRVLCVRVPEAASALSALDQHLTNYDHSS